MDEQAKSTENKLTGNIPSIAVGSIVKFTEKPFINLKAESSILSTESLLTQSHSKIISNIQHNRALQEERMSLDKARILYNLYSAQTEVLKLTALKRKALVLNNSRMEKSNTEKYQYNCKLVDSDYNGNSATLWRLQSSKISEEGSSSLMVDQEGQELPRQGSKRLLNLVPVAAHPTHNVSSTSIKNSHSGNFDTEEEGNNGTGLQSRRRFRRVTISPGNPKLLSGTEMLSPRSNPMTPKSDAALISPKLTSSSKLQDRAFLFVKEQTLATTSNAAAKPRRNSQTIAKAKSDATTPPHLQHILQSSTSTSTRTSEEKRLHKSITTFFSIRQYPHSYYFILIGILTCIAAVLGTQIYLTWAMYSHVTALIWQKEIIVNAQAQKDFTIRVGRRFRGISLLSSGLLTQAQLGKIVPNPVGVFVNLAVGELASLLQTNQAMLLDSSYLSPDDRDVLFANTIRIYGSIASDVVDLDVYTYKDTFQATNIILVQSQQALQLVKHNITSALGLIKLIIKNSLNDIIIQNDLNTAAVTASLAHNKAMFVGVTYAVSFVVVAVTVAMMMGLSIAMRQAYIREMSVLGHLARIPSASLQQIISQLNVFETAVVTANFSQELHEELDMTESAKRQHGATTRSKEDSARRMRSTASVRATLIRLQFIKNSFLMILFLMYIVVAVMIKYSWIVSTVDLLYYSVDVISFNRALTADIGMSISTFPEIVSTNSTSTICNMLAIDFYNEQMFKLTNVIDSMPIRLQNKDGTLDSYIQEILFENSCHSIAQSLYAACNAMTKGSQTFGLIKLMLSNTGTGYAG